MTALHDILKGFIILSKKVNLRNLLFGRYLPVEGVKGQFAEVQGFDQYEKTLQSVLKNHNDQRPEDEINIIPIRYKHKLRAAYCSPGRWHGNVSDGNFL